MSDSTSQDVFYGALIDAFLTTRMEFDKSLLALSSGGVGLLLTLVTTVGVPAGTPRNAAVASLVAFGLAILSVLVVFRVNATYLVALQKNDAERSDSLKSILESVDTVASLLFGVGVVATVWLVLAVLTTPAPPCSPASVP